MKQAGLSSTVTLLMAIAAGSAGANVWSNQPMLPVIAADLGLSDRAVALLPPATQLGFAAAIGLLVPLGDLMDRRRLVLMQLSGLVCALLVAATANGLPVLLVCCLAIGAGGATGQQIVTFGADLAAPESRGDTVGRILGGLLLGILLGRVAGGSISEHFGWRAVFLCGAAVAFSCVLVLARVLPRGNVATKMSWRDLMRSLVSIARDFPVLREAAVIQALLFGAFTAYWAVLALYLRTPPLELGGDAAGLFGFAGAAGIIGAPLAGRFVDRGSPRVIVLGSILIVFASYVVLTVWPTLVGLVIAAVFVDLGVQLAQTANLTIIYALKPDARGRMNTIFMGAMFLGGAFGATGSGLAWSQWGWHGVCAFGASLAMSALALQWLRGPAALALRRVWR